MGFVSVPSGDFRLRHARVARALLDATPPGPVDSDGLVDIDLEIRGGRIASIAPAGAFASAGAVDLDFGMVWPGFVDLHTHLDKAHIWPRASNPDGSFYQAATTVLADREANWSQEDVRRRFDFSLRCAY